MKPVRIAGCGPVSWLLNTHEPDSNGLDCLFFFCTLTAEETPPLVWHPKGGMPEMQTIKKAAKLFSPFRPLTCSLKGQALYAFSLLAIALLVTWLFNPLLSEVHGPAYLVSLTLSAIGLVLGVYILHCLGRAGRALAVIFSLIFVTFTYITTYYTVEPGPSFIGAIAETTAEEANVYFTVGAVVTVLGAVCAYALFVWKTRRFFVYGNVFILIFLILHIVFAQSRIVTGDAPKEMRAAAKWSMEYVCDPIKYALEYATGEKGKTDMLRHLLGQRAWSRLRGIHGVYQSRLRSCSHPYHYSLL